MPHKNGDVTKKADDTSNMEKTSVPAIEIRKCVKCFSLILWRDFEQKYKKKFNEHKI